MERTQDLIADKLEEMIDKYKRKGVKKADLAKKWRFVNSSNMERWVRSVRKGTANLNKLFEILIIEKTTLIDILKRRK